MSKKLGYILSLALVTTACGGESAPEHTFSARDRACAAGEEPSCTTDVPILDEEARTVVLTRAAEPATHAYVVTAITLPVATPVPGARGRAIGFNLDGIDTRLEPEVVTDCRRAEVDFESVSEPDGVGVDNAIEGFIPTIEMLLDAASCGGSVEGCLDGTLLAQINSGALVLLVEVGDVDDLRFDDHVTVQVALGELSSGEAPVLAGGRLAAGQTYRYALAPDGSPILLGPAYDGDIFRGRLRIATETLPLSINTGTRQLELSVLDAEMRFDISATALTQGVIGGGLPNGDVIAAAEMVQPGSAELVGALVQGAADLRPEATDATRCTAVSVGITFEAINAVLE